MAISRQSMELDFRRMTPTKKTKNEK